MKRILAWQLIMDNLAEIEDRPELIKPLLSKTSWTAQDIVAAVEIPVETKLAMALTPKLLEKKAINRFCYEMGNKPLALVNSRHIPCLLVLQLKQAAPDSQHYAAAKAQFLSLPVQDGVWHCVRESVMDHLKESAYASACLAGSAYAKGFQHDAVRWARAWQEAYAQERAWQLQCLAAILEGKEPAY